MESKEKPGCSLQENHSDAANDEPQVPVVDSASSFRLEKTQRTLKVSYQVSVDGRYIYLFLNVPQNRHIQLIGIGGKLSSFPP